MRDMNDVSDMSDLMLTVSIVTHNNAGEIAAALTSIAGCGLPPGAVEVVVVDNASGDGTPDIVRDQFPDVTLVLSENTGFGSGHNKAMERVGERAPYHLVMNPDIYFDPGELPKMLDFMGNHPEVGLVMPRVRYPDGGDQPLCKLLPAPLDLVIRRFLPGPLKIPFRGRLRRYEMRDMDPEHPHRVPHLSGCFMLLRNEVLRRVGTFDTRYFMYMEDVDFSRRIHETFDAVYYPGASIYHHYHKGSYKRLRNLRHHIRSAVKYFNKWGWFFDGGRKKINKKISRFS